MLFIRAVLLSVLLLFSASSYAAKTPVIIAYESTDLPPYYYGKSVIIPAKPGMAIDMLRLVQNDMPDVQFYFVRHTWPNCLKLLKEGQVDAVFPARHLDERAEFAAYPMKKGKLDNSKKLLDLTAYVYKLKWSKVSWDGKKFSNLKGKIAIPRGQANITYIKRMGHEVDSFPIDTRQALLRLLTGQAEASINMGTIADQIIKKEKKLFKNVEKIEIPFSESTNFLIFNKNFYNKNKDLSEKVWMLLKRVRLQSCDILINKYK